MTSDKRLSERVLKCAQNVSYGLGAGFLEKVYEKALCIELTRACIPFQCQQQFTISYMGEVVGNYTADIVVDNILIIELKALSGFSKEHDAQVMNYLKASGLTVGLLLNFGVTRLGIRRIVWNYDDKNNI
ncbi:MAG: GxxExxY protein [Gammaproteobacteria bacterium]|nr:MAG: GxxExxY protein [Gammaproteobacteria bacterium]